MSLAPCTHSLTSEYHLERPPPPPAFLRLNEPATTTFLAQEDSASSSGSSGSDETSLKHPLPTASLKKRFPNLTFSWGWQPATISFDWKGGVQEAYKMLRVKPDQPSLGQKLMSMAEDEFVSLSDPNTKEKYPSIRLGAILVIACTRAQSDSSPFSIWSSLVRYIYTRETLVVLEGMQLPMPCRFRPSSKRKRPFFLLPTFIEWTSAGNNADCTYLKAHTVTGHPEHGLAVHRPGTTAPLKPKLPFEPEELASKIGGDLCGFFAGDTAAIVELCRNLIDLPDRISEGIISFFRSFKEVSSSADKAPTFPSASTIKEADSPTSRTTGTKRSFSGSSNVKHLLQEITRLRAEVEQQKKQIEALALKVKVACGESQVDVFKRDPTNAGMLPPGEGMMAPVEATEKEEASITLGGSGSRRRDRIPPSSNHLLTTLATCKDASMGRLYAMRRLAEQLKEVSQKLKVRTEENVLLATSCAPSRKGIVLHRHAKQVEELNQQLKEKNEELVCLMVGGKERK